MVTVKIYDEGTDDFADRYTLKFTDKNETWYYGASDDADKPNGFFQYLGDDDYFPGMEDFLMEQKGISYHDAPTGLQRAITSYLTSLQEGEN